MGQTYDKRKYKKLGPLENLIEMELADQILKDAGVPYYIKNLEDSAYIGVYQLTHGYAEVWAPEEFREQIESLLAELRQSAGAIDEETLAAEAAEALKE